MSLKSMNSVDDRLSRVSALRPRLSSNSELNPENRASSNSEKLIQLLDGACRFNRLGSHMLVRRQLLEPHVMQVDPLALGLIESKDPDLIRDPLQWLFLDTETTGLAGGTGTYAFLVGIAWWENDNFIVEQYFMRDHSEEASLLLELAERLERRRVLVTFNGKSFDWPLLQTRYRMTRAGTIPEPLAHLDLLHPARQLWRLRLPSVALAQLERHVLQIDRGPDIPSATIPQRYFDFLRGASPEAIAEVFVHNQMDLCGLASLSSHVMHILADPERNGCGSEELFGVSRMLQKRGKKDLAGRVYRMAIDGGLPKPAEQIAQRELALLAKRQGDFEVSNTLWENLLGGTIEGLKAYEQLAIYYEHHARAPQRAALLSREALGKLQEAFRDGRLPTPQYLRWHASFQHRLSRLVAKQFKVSDSLRISDPNFGR
jgi:uncharacterized protein